MTSYRPYVPPRSISYQSSPPPAQPFTSRRNRPNSAVSSVSDVSIDEIPPYHPTDSNGSLNSSPRQVSAVSSSEPKSRAYNSTSSNTVINNNHGHSGDNSDSSDDDSMYTDDRQIPPRSRDNSLSDVAEAFRNQAFIGQEEGSPVQSRRDRPRDHSPIHDGGKKGGRRTPTQASDLREAEMLETVSHLRREVKQLRKELREQCIKQDEIDLKFKGWMEIMTHNSKALIQNTKVDVHKPYMRIHPLLNETGAYPDMAIFPTTVASLMKLNEAHLTSLVVFYNLQEPKPVEYYQKYTALRDHLGIDP